MRFPKAYATSEENLRYADRVREQVAIFMNGNIPHNYFTGERNVGLEASLQEAEVLYSANDAIKAMADSGELQALHEKFNSLHQRSQTEYLSIRDKINNIIIAAQSKEDEISQEAMADYAQLGLTMHNSTETGYSTILSGRAYITLNNLSLIDSLKATVENKTVLRA